jgi:hypothetical protein
MIILETTKLGEVDEDVGDIAYLVDVLWPQLADFFPPRAGIIGEQRNPVEGIVDDRVAGGESRSKNFLSGSSIVRLAANVDRQREQGAHVILRRRRPAVTPAFCL